MEESNMKHVAYKEDIWGNKRFLREDGEFTYVESDAKQYKGRFLIELLGILLKIFVTLGVTVKFKKI